MAPILERIDFADIKAWIAEQEALSQPATLAPAIRKAIADLKAAIVQHIPAPAPGGEDYVSALQCKLKLGCSPSLTEFLKS